MSNDNTFWGFEVARTVVKAFKEESRQWRSAYHRRTDVMEAEYKLFEDKMGGDDDVFIHYGEDDTDPEIH